MPGTTGGYEHVGACFLNESDMRVLTLAAVAWFVFPGLDAGAWSFHDPAGLNACSSLLRRKQ